MQNCNPLTDGREKPDVELTGQDGNAFMIMGLCSRALRKAKYSKEEIDQFLNDCKSGDYDHLLAVCMEWLNVS